MTAEEIENELYEVEDLEFYEQIGILENLIRHADALQHEELQFSTRLEMVSAGVFSGYIEKAFIAFTWCLAKLDEKPEEYAMFLTDILWAYKWICQATAAFSSISLLRIQDTLQDCEDRYVSQNISLRPLLSQRVLDSFATGKLDEVKKYLDGFTTSRRDMYSDCSACEQNFLVNVALYQNDFEKALRYAAPIFEGKKACAEVPHITYAIMTLPALFVGETEKAKGYAANAMRLCLDNRDFLNELSEVMNYFVAIKNMDKALEIFNTCYRWELDSFVHDNKQDFACSAGLLFEHLQTANISLSLPLNSPLYSAGNSYRVSDLRSHFEAQANTIAAAFDERNGNDYVSKCQEELRQQVRTFAK